MQERGCTRNEWARLDVAGTADELCSNKEAGNNAMKQPRLDGPAERGWTARTHAGEALLSSSDGHARAPTASPSEAAVLFWRAHTLLPTVE